MARTVLVAAVVGLLLPTARAGEDTQPVRLPVSLATAKSPDSVVVEKGDHLWKISARHLHRVLGHEASSAEISPYWVEVIEANRDGLRSGDPDLIYPGEVVKLPATEVNEQP